MAVFDTIALDTHEMRSVRRWLHTRPELADLPIYIERPRKMARPSLWLEEMNRPNSPDRGRLMVSNMATWQVTVCGTDHWTTKRLVAVLCGHLRQIMLIPLRLFDWSYPAVKARSAGTGDDETKTGHIGVTALDHEGNETLAGMATVEVPLGADVEALWPDWPQVTPVAVDGYRVYFGWGADDLVLWEEFEADAHPPERWHVRRLSVSTDQTTSRTKPPTDSEISANRFMRVTGIDTRMMEHGDRDGIWDGIVSIRTETDSARVLYPGLAASDVPTLLARVETTVSTA